MDFVANLASADPHRRGEAQWLADGFADRVAVSEGVARWRSNGAVPPADICALWAHLGKPFDLAATAAARDADWEAFAAAYRSNWNSPTAEQRSEMRAVGLGDEVVDIVAGRSTILRKEEA